MAHPHHPQPRSDPPCVCPLSVPDEYRCGKALGPVESIQEHPRNGSQLLIGYSRGLVVLWEQSTRVVQHLFLGNQVLGLAGLWPCVCVCPQPSAEPPVCPLQQLESLAWEQSGKSIVSSHSDGGYMVWAVSSTGQRSQQPVMSTIPYGTGWGSGGIWGWELIPPPSQCYNHSVAVSVPGPFPCKAISKILWRTCESG